MSVSGLDLFTIGIGPSSSHTVGPMRAARRFASALDGEGWLSRVVGVRVDLFGSLGATGRGHGTDAAILLGLEGSEPETVDPDNVATRLEAIRASAELRLLGRRAVRFAPAEHLRFRPLRSLPRHPNGMQFAATDAAGTVLAERRYYSVGGGFVASDSPADEPLRDERGDAPVPYPFSRGAELLAHCAAAHATVGAIALENERARWGEQALRGRLLAVWAAMRDCVQRGCRREGVNECVAKGLAVVQGDADTDLEDYPDDAFDYVILSQTLQATRRPRLVLEHMLRIGRHGIVSFPNFGHWRIRLQIFFGGHMPRTDNLPYAWYETPNIHFCSIKDFRELCRAAGAKMEQAVALNAWGRRMRLKMPWWFWNLFGEQAVFLLSRRS